MHYKHEKFMKNARASFMINNNILTHRRLRILSLDAFVGSLSVWILFLCFFEGS